MENLSEMQKFFLQQQLDESEAEISKNLTTINNFINFCNHRQINLDKDNFEYIPKIGIVVNYPNIVHLLNHKIVLDKEELVEVSILENEYKKPVYTPGYYSTDNYIVMAHPYFRRGHYAYNNFAPSFINEFSCLRKDNIKKYLAIDSDRVRIDLNNYDIREYDTWFGSKFTNNIKDIKDGIVKLTPPLDLEKSYLELFFGNTYSLDIKWSSKNGIKVFQAEEFKQESSRIIKNEIEYYPVKYIHAEYDIETDNFRHFDGAIHFYTEQEYFQRRQNDYNHNNKNSLQLKSLSQKLFKVNGKVTTMEWVNLVSHYLSGNPLIFEYFGGKLPDYLLEKLELIKSKRSGIHST